MSRLSGNYPLSQKSTVLDKWLWRAGNAKSHKRTYKLRQVRVNNINIIAYNNATGIAQSAQRLATGWTVQGSNTGGCEISRGIQTGPRVHPGSSNW
jgi:hypothetical protein